jgi:type I restriction enzyme R subunit
LCNASFQGRGFVVENGKEKFPDWGSSLQQADRGEAHPSGLILHCQAFDSFNLVWYLTIMRLNFTQGRSMARNEENTKFRRIHPKLEASGWTEHEWQIEMEYAITAGRIQWDGKSARRARPIYADYLLRYKPSVAIAVIEAKDENKHHLEGEAQAKDYAKKLGLWFAYSTNGHQIEFYDLKKGTQQTVANFHNPEDLWELYLQYSGLDQAKKHISALTQDYYDESQIGKRRRPRYYQEQAVRSAIEVILKGQKRVLVAQATGTGKTFTSIQLVYKLFKARVAKKILFIVDRNLLADQAFNDFNNAMDKDACHRLSPRDEKFPLGRDLYFGIYQSLVGEDDEGQQLGGRQDRYKEFPPDFFDLIVIDEAHRGGANQEGSWFQLLEYFKSAVQVGLTATPKREESNNTYRYFGNPVINYSLKNGIEDGFLSPYVIKRVTSNIDALGYRPEHGDIRDVTGKVIENRDYLTPDFERQLSIPERTRAFAYHLLRHLFSTDPLGKTIVFCIDQNHALDMAKYVSEAFLKYKDKYQLEYSGHYAVRITGNDKDANGKYPQLERFSDLESNEPIVVTTSRLLTTGVDVQTVRNVVLFRNIGSMVEFKQIIGRGTRIYDHKDKSKEKLGFFILEYANFSTQLFNDPEWDDEPEEVIDEGSIDIPGENGDEYQSGAKDLDSPPPKADGEAEDEVDDDGIYVEKDEETAKQLRYRMSEEFLRGFIQIAAESVSYTGHDGKPLSPEKFVVFQSEVFRQHFANLEDFKKVWANPKSRKDFMEDRAIEWGLNIDALTSIFFQKHTQREVDAFDVIANLLYGEAYITKYERIQKAKSLHSEFFASQGAEAQGLINDLLDVYKEMEHKPFSVSRELWQTPKLRRHGTITEIQGKVGGSDALLMIINGLQEALYDERIAA